MNNIIKIFSIKDLESFSGIKAHTIRIWEKRYNLLQPFRSDSNIRYYDEVNFIKLLNIASLYQEGIKISKIARLSNEQIEDKVKELKVANNNPIVNRFLISMLQFDVNQFNGIYNELRLTTSLREIFIEIFVPLLDKIGFLWQTKSIVPAHEHFISNLIMQKIYAAVDQVNKTNSNKDQETFVLFLPLNEIHELGLLFLYYELSQLNKNTIYLGRDIEVEHLVKINSIYPKVHYITYVTVESNEVGLGDYVKNIDEKLLKGTTNKFSILGKINKNDFNRLISNNISYFLSIDQLLKAIK